MSVAPAPGGLRELRRGQILEEARALVAEGGLTALTIGALEKRVPFTRGVITHHFANKDAIVLGVLESAVAEIDAATRQDASAAPDFAGTVHAVLDTKVRGFLRAREASWILLAFWGRVRSDAAAAEATAALFARYRAEGAELVRWGQRRGLVAGDADADAFATLLVGQVIGIVTQALLAPELDVGAAIAAGSRASVAGLAAA